MDTWLIDSLWVGLALISTMVSIRIGISVALVDQPRLWPHLGRHLAEPDQDSPRICAGP